MNGYSVPWMLRLLRTIRTRPGAVLGSLSVRPLETYIQGYCQARADLGVGVLGGSQESNDLQLFSEWMRRRHGLRNTNWGWLQFVEELDPSDQNIFTFYRLFEEYLADMGVDFAEVTPWEFAPWK